jgi:hypothetical protein
MVLGLKKEEWRPVNVLHSLPKRKLIANLLYTSQSVFTDLEMVNPRAAAIDTLVSFGLRKQIRKRRVYSQYRNCGILLTPQPKKVLSYDQEQKKGPMILTDTNCILCICKTSQMKIFCWPREAREHIEYQHLLFEGG